MSDKLQFVDVPSFATSTKLANLDYKQFSKRRRPHIHSPGSVLFVTYRLTGSVPKSTVREYKARKKWLENESNSLTESGSLSLKRFCIGPTLGQCGCKT
jgi:hypothetical protein